VGPENEDFLDPEMVTATPPHTSCSKTLVHKITYVLVFYMPPELNDLILMGANPLLGPLEGVDPRNGFVPYKQQVY
jgi:hypothetical protein